MARAPQIRLYLAQSKDGGILFDLHRNRFLKLNPLGVEIWTALGNGAAQSAVIADIAHHYQVAPETVSKDVNELLSRAAGLGILPGPFQQAIPQNDPPAENRPSCPWYGRDLSERERPRKLPVLLALCGLLAFDLLLAIRSLSGLCAAVQRWPAKIRQRPAALINEICTAVDKACVWYPKKALCLQRSAVTACLLRTYGVAAKMVIAVRPVPFMAHAWVELDGAVVNDRPAVKNLYTVLARF